MGLGVRPFTMAVAVLTLRNLDRLYARGAGYAAGEVIADLLAAQTIEYPVIFFRSASGLLRHVGDGSWCATGPVHAAAAESHHVLTVIPDFEVEFGAPIQTGAGAAGGYLAVGMRGGKIGISRKVSRK